MLESTTYPGTTDEDLRVDRPLLASDQDPCARVVLWRR